MDRREFLKKSGQAALAIGAGLTLEEVLSGCATTVSQDEPAATNLKQQENIIYPHVGKADQKKIQPPEHGCLVGFRSRKVHEPLENKLGRKPSIEVLCEDFTSTSRIFPTKWAENPERQGVTLFVYMNIGCQGLTDFLKGKEDKDIEVFAEGAAEYGEKNGSFFITTMAEMNASWWPYGLTNKFVPAWKRAWHIFEQKGVNKYATWVWEPYCLDATIESKIDHPDRYYPGDEFVDWVGLSAYNVDEGGMGPSFKTMVSRTYNDMSNTHPTKPIMQAEFGKLNLPGQAGWIKNAYQTIKSTPGMKAAIYQAVFNVDEDTDFTFREESYQPLREILKDPYWIMAKGA